MITINGNEIPTPSKCRVGIMDISKAERNALGDMIVERINTKRKIELAWAVIAAGPLQQVLNLVSPVFFPVTYPDPEAGTMRTGTFYCGDRNVDALEYIDGEIQWKDVAFNLIER